MKLRHIDKVKMARRMLTAEEIRHHTPIFQSVAWIMRGIYIKNRLAKQYGKLHT